MLAVVMGAPDYKVRFSDAASMLNYGFGICKLYVDENQNQDGLDRIEVKGGTDGRLPLHTPPASAVHTGLGGLRP